MPPNILSFRLPYAPGGDHIYKTGPTVAGAIFLQATGPGGSVPFYGREV